MSQRLPDADARNQALDIGGSYIVQAPAGSGKTELLTLRYLKLLAVCEQPEEVLAITFTRKAASEMRDRIIRVLNWSSDCLSGRAKPADHIEEQRLAIAKDVLRVNEEKQWRLLQNPSRFRVQTIDSFCFYLANQLPILSQVGGNPNVTENIEPCFREAVTAVLENLESESPLAAPVATVLTHLDNDIAAIEQQLISLLFQRDQWTDYIQQITEDPNATRQYLQQTLDELIAESLAEVRNRLVTDEAQLVTLINFAAENLQREGKLPESAGSILPFTELPATHADSLPAWRFLLKILLTKEGGWLRAATKVHGFPPGEKSNKEHLALCKQRKEERLALVQSYQESDDLLEALNYVRLLPDPELDSEQWQFLVALCQVLHGLSGELLLAFRNFRVVDYTQTGAAALLALGDPEQPTDLALALDNVIEHILVDEFQDTSQLQLDLLQNLTRGWQPDDGRTLFLVGDAMQSCYGFRNANVGIYLSVLESGVGELSLTPLQLSSNFRSQRPVVEWVNQVFQRAFPQQANISHGAVPYASAEVIHENQDSDGVSVDLIHYQREDRLLAQIAEADLVTSKTLSLRQRFPEDSIAVLVRTRGQLQSIIPALRNAGLQWTASDIDRLSSLPIIEDLMSLVRVIVNPGDRLAWLALLRAPWCGLAVDDLYLLASASSENSLWQNLQQHRQLKGLSEFAQQALPAFVAAMEFAMAMRFRRSLRHLVEASWSLLRGLNCCRSQLDENSINRFFQLLEEQESAGGLADLFKFEDIVAEAFVPSPARADNDGGLHLLTMHKAKGLEYDHVILPGLGRAPRSDNRELLTWHQRLNQDQTPRLFLAGVTATGSEDSPLYQLLRHERRRKAELESTRLLYIAVTRARKSAALVASQPRNSKGDITEPRSSSLLKRIWRELQEQELVNNLELEDYCQDRPLAGSIMYASYPQKTPIRRFNQPLQLRDVELDKLKEQIAALEPAEETQARISDENRFELESTLGTLIHQCLERFVLSNDRSDYLANLDQQHSYWHAQLEHLDLSAQAEEQAIAFVLESVRNTLTDPDLAWVFDGSLQDSQCEYALTRHDQGRLSSFVVDRTFIDNNGVRWIIDYKTAVPGGTQSQEEFIKQQVAEHQLQLQNYRSLFESLDTRPVKTALLLTSVPELVELPSGPAGSPG
jgi:ATP-dependent helicase/nuclease subunit A